MQNDIQRLEQLNIQIGNEEAEGDREWFESIIAPKLAFRRADKRTIDDRKEFLDKVRPSEPHETEVESINFYGDRAVVTCIVTLKSASGDKRFHNLRMFVQDHGSWKLLGWANEPL